MTSVIRVLAAASALAGLAAVSGGGPQPRARRWYKGNLHTHTTSDGDSTPETVARWYKSNGYQFLALSDHNVLTEAGPLNALLGEAGKFLLMPGEEVTDSFRGAPVHVNGYNLSRLVQPTHGETLAGTIQGNVNAIREAGGLPSVNHPNFRWAFGSRELIAVENLRLFEVYNGHPTVHNRGGGGAESLDEMWDALLAGGRRMYGIAVDDAHHFKVFGKQYSNPGRGWVVVRAESLANADIVAAIAAGDFYSSTGVELSDVRTSESGLSLTINPSGDTRYRTYFLGPGGRIVKTETGLGPSCRLGPGDKYLRARVEASTGDTAWVQPVFATP